MNAISYLFEYTQKYALSPPIYTYNSVTSSEGKINFICELKVQSRTDLEPLVFSTMKSYPSKKDAKMAVSCTAQEWIDQLPDKSSASSRPEECIHIKTSNSKTEIAKKEVNSFSIIPLLKDKYKTIILVDLENVPQAGPLRYRSDVFVIFFLSHNHAYYCSPSGDFLFHMPSNQCLEVCRSSLKDAVDHHLTFMAGYIMGLLGTQMPPNLYILSRDNAGACSAFCAQNCQSTNRSAELNVKHVTRIEDMQDVLDPF